MTVTKVGNKIYLLGGCVSNQPQTTNCDSVTDTAESFSPTATGGADFVTLSSMPRKRCRHSAAAIGSNIVVIGGRDVADNLIPEVDVYNTATDTWSTVGVTPVNVSDHGGFAYNNLAFIVGGYDANYVALGDVWSYNLATNAWSSSYPGLNVRRGDIAVEILNDNAYAIGGFNDQNFCQPLTTVEEFDLIKNVWTLRQPTNVFGGDKASAVIAGEVMSIGGEQKDSVVNCSYSQPVFSVETYEPSGNSWTMQRSLLESKFRFDAEEMGGLVYVFGGQMALSHTVLSVSPTVEVFTPSQSSTAASLAAVPLTFAALAVGADLVGALLN